MGCIARLSWKSEPLHVWEGLLTCTTAQMLADYAEPVKTAGALVKWASKAPVTFADPGISGVVRNVLLSYQLSHHRSLCAPDLHESADREVWIASEILTD